MLCLPPPTPHPPSPSENWNFMMTDLMVQPPYCISSGGPDDTCGSPAFAAIYFISFMFFAVFIFDALLTATVLEAFWLDHEPKEAYRGWEDPVGRRLYHFTHGAAAAFQEVRGSPGPVPPPLKLPYVSRCIHTHPALPPFISCVTGVGVF
jgi:hypothetical protein